MDIETLTEENNALESSLAIARRQLAGMRDVAKALAGRIDLDEILPAILEKVTELCDCDRATLFVVDERRDELWSRVAQGVAPIRISRRTGIAGFVATSGIGNFITFAFIFVLQ